PALAEAPEATDVERELGAVVGAVLADGDSLEAVARPLLAEIAILTGLESAVLAEVDLEAGTQKMRFVENRGTLQIPEGVVVPWEDTICIRALARGVRATNDVPGDLPGSGAAAVLGIQTYVSAPVVTGDGSFFGMLCAASTGVDPVNERTASLLEVFARVLAEAVDRQGDGPADGQVRVVIADDSAVVRRVLQRGLSADERFTVVGEVGDGAGVSAACSTHAADLLLLDLDMPSVDGLQALAALRQVCPDTVVVVVTGSDDEALAAQALALGAAAVLDKRNVVDVASAVAAVLPRLSGATAA
ncbi:MAG TPA: response regulator, partial [Acidimicrobiales bacterium]|nr:response regulator [Acidimicrobiales bacterium]